MSKLEESVSGRLQAAPEAFAIPLLPLLKRRNEPLSFEVEHLSGDRDVYLLRYFLWGQLKRGQRFTKLELHVRLPAKGRFSIYSMWPDTEYEVTVGASTRLDVGVATSLRLEIPAVSLAPGVELGGGFHADADGRFLLFKEWQRVRATVQATGIAGRAADWLIDRPKRLVGNVEFLVVVLAPRGIPRMNLRVEGAYWIKEAFWRTPIRVNFTQRARTELNNQGSAQSLDGEPASSPIPSNGP